MKIITNVPLEGGVDGLHETTFYERCLVISHYGPWAVSVETCHGERGGKTTYLNFARLTQYGWIGENDEDWDENCAKESAEIEAFLRKEGVL